MFRPAAGCSPDPPEGSLVEYDNSFWSEFAIVLKVWRWFPIVTAVHGETSTTADNLDPRIANKIRPIIYQDNPVDNRPTTREKLPRIVIRSNAKQYTNVCFNFPRNEMNAIR
jgi:hypothetical protein